MNFKKKAAYFVGACGVALLTVAPAITPIVENGVQIVNAANTNDGKTYSVNIHKYLSNDKDGKGAHDGTEISGGLTDHEPIGGVEFTISEVDTTSVKLSDLKPENAKLKENGKVVKAITGKDGNASFKDLPKGVYKVHETAQKGIETSTDFLLKLPMTKADGTGYLDTVNIYPKNKVDEKDSSLKLDKQLLNGDKGITNINAAVGSTLTWKVIGHVPSTVVSDVEADKFGSFHILDPIRKTLTVDKSKIVGSINGSVNLEKEDFTVSDVADDGEAKGVNNFNTIKIALTEAGLKKAAGQTVSFTISTTINSLDLYTEADGVAADKIGTVKPINNTITATATSAITGIPDKTETTTPDDHRTTNPDGKDKPALPDEKPTDKTPNIHIGRVDITKVDEENEATKLEGAQFKIALSEEDVKAGKFVKAPKGMPGQKAGEDITFTTDKNGVANVVGLQNKQKYFMVETQAPKGYTLTDEIFEVTADEDTKNDSTIKDGKDIFGGLIPATGSTGRLILTAVGAIMIIGASFYFFVYKRKEEKEA